MSTSAVVPSTIDLVDLPSLKTWLMIAQGNKDWDGVLQDLITGFSQFILNQCGVKSFNSVQRYVEIYDGNGSQRLFTFNRPIVSVNTIQIGDQVVPQSTTLTSLGWYIEQSKNSIAIRTGRPTSNGTPWRFTYGMGNIQVDYTAGYERVPADLAEAAMKGIAINFARKDWKDLASKSISTGGGGSGTTTYQKWAIPPEIADVIDFYSRIAMP